MSEQIEEQADRAEAEAPASSEGALISTPGGGAIPADEVERITSELIAALKTVYDPEIPVDIYELGLIYKVELDDDRKLNIDMTLTAPGCPVAGEMPGWVENAASAVEGIREVEVKMVFDPPWTPDRMSEEAQVALNWW
ncbi:MAG TPA: SUF system Fe-S cluster assembly protein [Devosiaceae bacterium]